MKSVDKTLPDDPKKRPSFCNFLVKIAKQIINTSYVASATRFFRFFLISHLALSKKRNVSCLLRTEYNLENVVDIAFIRYFHVKKYKFKEL